MERFYNFDLVTYNDQKTFETALQLANVRYYVGILHDKDKNDDNTDKVTHYHYLINFSNAKTVSSVISKFCNLPQNTRVIPCVNKLDRFEYLTHKNNPDKFQYSDDMIFGNGFSFFSSDDKGSIALSIIDDILNHVSFRELAIRYGRDVIINYNKYCDFARAIYNEEHKFAPDIPCFDDDGTVTPFEKYEQLVIDKALAHTRENKRKRPKKL